MFQIVVHEQAKNDIKRNADWWAEHHSIDQALAWSDAVERQLQDLSQNPERFGIANENGRFAYEIRQILIGLGKRRSYRAIFTIKGDSVHILTIQRAEQSQLAHDDLPMSV